MGDREIGEMLRHLLEDYDVRLKPNYLGKRVQILVDLTVLSFSNLDAINMVSYILANLN